MAKVGLEGATIEPVLSAVAERRGWTLCVGAGTSLPAFPTWWTLVHRLLMRSSRFEPDASVDTLREFGPDAAIQAVANRSGWSDVERVQALSEELFRDLLGSAANPSERDAVASALASSRPGQLTKQKWSAFLDFFDHNYPLVTAQGLARVIADTRMTPREVSRVISFNAESLLAALINGRLCQKNSHNMLVASQEGELTQHLDLITHTISHRRADRIPYFFCHGAVSVPETIVRFASDDKLVWSESEYLTLNNSNYSWQSATFLEACSSTSVVFVGVSLTDPNMRRWLSWSHTLRLSELVKTKNTVGTADSAPHYWICKRSTSAETQRWTEAAVSHLGVRLVWIDDWSAVEGTLRRMLQ